MQNIKDLTLNDIEKWLTLHGEKAYKALQVFAWVFNKGVNSFDDMTDLSKALREKLKENFFISKPKILATEKSQDGTQKLLLELEDLNCIESVLIPEEDRLTLCLSSQVGCPLDCGFCMTGKGGFVRNLKLSEIVNQVFAAQSLLSVNQKITNLVLMGMGEPLLNYDEVIKFLNIAIHQKGLGFAPKRVTVSTAGIVPMIERLGREIKVNLAVSLNATTDEIRNRLMPINKKYPLQILLDACRKYPAARNRYITFEYILIEDVNDSIEDAKRLVKLLQGIKCKINLIPFNPFPGAEFKRPSEKTILNFQKVLMDNNYIAIIRASKGQDISAACGQLRGKLQR
ncbi:MAG TPA: 23S rRNA (adenine(2503)-C(2))-methyltransferase RlmN [Deltaproteobacteria bacterium]|nr:MAG: 23S rRNA (adenine(2503)-C(2))-methyltransferase [Deltaproteobacteria bacterium GWB2_42_7]OGP38737.1 MAG: 23S rRNA (adenine(2503)-C(2))-methyltransferase [Deltaproteobacteria bacterium GWD2_42_10]OGP47900.1 MAG: 23S rRNA (adenine(2503)-C(2))-methyltransferase [Deltaproteobacteria bacterium GWF2_42_12]OGQ30456.1 MAG: 23S rRNA (adenine(2503)-C(2))-methyltransferase [Deltaproteobacteria bacterium RIFCSPHIGHO2_02_FULL_42_44]OGQ69141.1 MAG: 23S rRNA (adenine(2503)-C(2))-methyltransferase [Del